MKKLSICYVSREYPPETGYGGIGTYCWEMANALVKNGHQVIIVAKAVDKASYQKIKGVHVYRILPRFAVSNYRILWRLNPFWQGYRLAVALALQEIDRRHHIDIIEAPEIHAEPFIYRVLPIYHKPIIIRLHSGTALGFRYNNAPGIPRFRINATLEKWMVNHADYITSPSNALIEICRPLFNLVPSNFTVIPNPVDTSLFHPPAVEQTGKRQVLFVGRLEWWKGPDLLMNVIPEIIDEFGDVEFCFIGTNPVTHTGQLYSETLMKNIPTRYASHICFKSAVSRDELALHYRQATTVVVPSRWEGFGYVCAEAMASGKVTIASRVGGLQEIIEDNVSGILFDPSSSMQLAQTLAMVLRNPELRRDVGQKARQRIESHFSLHQILNRMVSVYEGVLG